MGTRCATRALANAKRIRSVAPDLFSRGEPLEGNARVVPFDVFDRFDQMPDEELRQYPRLLEAAKALREQDATAEFHIFGRSLFTGTFRFVKITFQVGADSLSVSDADFATILQYTQLALPVISKYVSQYGENLVRAASEIVEYTVNVPSGTYSSDTLESWLRAVALQNYTIDQLEDMAFVVCNPEGVVNSDSDPSQGYGGYHEVVSVTLDSGSSDSQTIDIPYCFVNVQAQATNGTEVGDYVTLQDLYSQYATNLSHEMAEMIADPEASPWRNPEVCDPCASNCLPVTNLFGPGSNWQAFFSIAPDGSAQYLRSSIDIPPSPFTYDFYVAAVVHPDWVDDCPAPLRACNYGPDARAGVNEVLFYDPAGYGEVYSIDQSGSLTLQTTHPDWRNTWSLIVPGGAPSLLGASGWDVLFYDQTQGVGEFYQTGRLGDMNRLNQYTNWRNSWSLIVPGHFSDNAYGDLLFYDRTHGVGQFYHTDAHGLAGAPFATYTNWRTTWSVIVPGHFSNSAYTDLLFYDPTGDSGVAELYHTSQNGFDDYAYASYSNWLTTWSLIIPGHFSDSSYTDLLLYDRSGDLGVGAFFHTNQNGFDEYAYGNFTNWRTTWSQIVPGRFSNSSYTDLLFYDPGSGLGSFFHTDRNGFNDYSYRDYQGWLTSWSIMTPIPMAIWMG